MSIKQGPVVEIKPPPALLGEMGDSVMPAREQVGLQLLREGYTVTDVRGAASHHALTLSGSLLPSLQGRWPLGLGLLSTNTTSQHAWSSLCWLFPAFITLSGGKKTLGFSILHSKYQERHCTTPAPAHRDGLEAMWQR